MRNDQSIWLADSVRVDKKEKLSVAAIQAERELSGRPADAKPSALREVEQLEAELAAKRAVIEAQRIEAEAIALKVDGAGEAVIGLEQEKVSCDAFIALFKEQHANKLETIHSMMAAGSHYGAHLIVENVNTLHG